MRVQNVIVFLVAISSFYNASAQGKYKANIDHVTVFLAGAEINSSAKVSLKQGENEVLFTNIAGNIDQQSLSLGADNGAIIQSTVFQNNYLGDEPLSPLAAILKDSIETIETTRSAVNNQLNVVNEQINILSQNKQVSGANTGLSVTELQKMLDLVKARLGSLLNEKDKYVVAIKKIDEQLGRIRKQYEEEKVKYFQPGGQLLVTFYCPRAVNAAVNISYVTRNAGWTPTYDIRVDKINEPVQLFYKANIYQNSGISWNDVKLSLSTGNPNEGSQSPVLNPWYLAFYEPQPRAYSKAMNGAAREDAQLYVTDGAQIVPQSSLGNHVTVDNGGINTSFDIDIPYTILSDGKMHNVAIKKYELPASYVYYAVPKMDNDAFLQAKITNWETLDLLPAETNIFYEGTYVGKGYLDMRDVKDTMDISLGRDKKIVIKRERNKELKSVKTIGTNVKETFVYTTSVRNTRKDAVTIIIVDQVPVSNDKDIEIEDKDIKGAEYNESTGEVKWTIILKPNESQSLKIGYTVKYPKGKRINL